LLSAVRFRSPRVPVIPVLVSPGWSTSLSRSLDMRRSPLRDNRRNVASDDRPDRSHHACRRPGSQYAMTVSQLAAPRHDRGNARGYGVICSSADAPCALSSGHLRHRREDRRGSITVSTSMSSGAGSRMGGGRSKLFASPRHDHSASTERSVLSLAGVGTKRRRILRGSLIPDIDLAVLFATSPRPDTRCSCGPHVHQHLQTGRGRGTPLLPAAPRRVTVQIP